MKKGHLHTTLSMKHMGLIDKYAEIYGSKQKALEIALENMENLQPAPSSPEEKLWMQFAGVDTACFIQKDGLKMLLDTADMDIFLENIEQAKSIEYQVEKYLHKPLKESSLKEVIDGMVINAKMAHWFELVDYKEEGDHYTIIMAHVLGINGSRLNKILVESVFKTYGARFETTISERTFFIKIFK